jgi:Uma2 family endonuclease
MTIRLDHPTDPDAFLRWLERQDRKYELVDGELIMMTYVSKRHAVLASRLTVLLDRLLRGSGLFVTSADFGVRTRMGVRFPDIMVEGGTLSNAKTAEEPFFLAEILSPSTVREDFERKPAEYMALPSLSAYLVLSQDEPRVWLWRRSDAGWPAEPAEIAGFDATVEIAVAGQTLTLPLGEIYAGFPRSG